MTATTEQTMPKANFKKIKSLPAGNGAPASVVYLASRPIRDTTPYGATVYRRYVRDFGTNDTGYCGVVGCDRDGLCGWYIPLADTLAGPRPSP